MSPRGWTAQQEDQNYQDYRARKLANGSEPRDKAGYLGAVAFWEEQRRKGDRFRDIAYEELGYLNPGQVKERYQNTAWGRRFQDIGNGRLQEAWEFKAGGGDREETLRQLEKDGYQIRRGWTVNWVMRDMSQMDPKVRERIKEMARDNPGRFRYLDLGDERSVQDFARLRPRESTALRRAAQRFDSEEAVRVQSRPASDTRGVVVKSEKRGRATPVPSTQDLTRRRLVQQSQLKPRDGLSR